MKDIIIRDLTKSYGDHVVLDHFSLTLPAGRTTCLMAPSGQGKTTLLRLLMGLEQPDSGDIVLPESLQLSAVFQEDRLCEDFGPVANLRLVHPALSMQDALSALESMGLSDAAQKPVREFSGGMKRRLALLRALICPCDLLLLDEPFTGLDEALKSRVIQLTKDACQNKTVLLVTHSREEAEQMDANIVTLNEKEPT